MVIPRNDELHSLRVSLEKRGDELALELAKVRNQINRCTPVAVLPDELLEQIFAICVSGLYEYKKPKNRLAWTQVCQHWRNISLSSARLWRCIDLTNSNFAREFLNRSKLAPLSLVSTSPLKLFVDDLAPHADRLQTIDIMLFPDAMSELFSSIGTNTTNLSTFSLRIPPISLPCALDISVSTVQRLSVDSVAVRWDSCSNLTHLNIRGLMGSLCPSFLQLFAILRSSPNLEHLQLENLDPMRSGDLSPVALPSLRQACFSGHPDIIRTMLSNLTIPSQSKLRISVYPTSLLTSLSDIFLEQRPYACSSHTVQVSRHNISLFTETAFPCWSETPLISVRNSRVAFYAASTITGLIHPSNIISLELSPNVLLDISREELEILFRSVSNLRALRVAFNDLKNVFPSLSEHCKSLATLEFGRVTDSWWHFKQYWFQGLLACAAKRYSTGIPFQSLCFHQCQGMTDESDSNVAALRGLVGNVSMSIES